MRRFGPTGSVVPRLSRRSFLAGGGAALGALAASGPLAGCSVVGGGSSGPSTLRIANWPAYIDPGPDGTVSRFQRATGVETIHSEPILDNESFYRSIMEDMSAQRDVDYDLVMVTGWLAARMASLGWLEPLAFDLAPNSVNLSPDLKNPPWDLLGRYTLPWQLGMVVIAYNDKETEFEITGLGDLFDERLKGRVSLLNEYRDTLGTFGIAEGIDITRPKFDEFSGIFDWLEQATHAGQFHSYTGNEYIDGLISGDLAVSLAWSGDVPQMALDHSEIKLVVPAAGTVLFSDVMAVLKGSPNLDTAMEWINFVYDLANAARITEYVEFISPVVGADSRLEAMGEQAAALVDNPLVFPSEQDWAKLHSFGMLEGNEELKFEDRFGDLVMAAA